MSGVKFVRIRGRIVPIMDKARQGIKKAVNAVGPELERVERGAQTLPGQFAAQWSIPTMMFGNFVGKSIGASAAQGDRKRLLSDMKSDKDMVDAKKAASSVMKNVTVITNAQDVNKAFRNESDFTKAQFKHMATTGIRNNAFAMRYKDKDYVFTTKRVSRSVLGHELGHIQDYRTNGTPGLFSRMFGHVSGATLRRERRAWELNPYKEKESKRIRESALGTYEKTTRGAQIGTAAGAGAIWAILRKLGRA